MIPAATAMPAIAALDKPDGSTSGKGENREEEEEQETELFGEKKKELHVEVSKSAQSLLLINYEALSVCYALLQ